MPMLRHLALCLVLPVALAASDSAPSAAMPLRPSRSTDKSYFPFRREAATTPDAWQARRTEIKERAALAAGLFPLPSKTPLNPVIHGRVERDDYTIDRVYFESFPGHFVTGNLYLPKKRPAEGKMPGVLSPHGHWPNGRFIDLGADSAAVNGQLASGAERFESGARSFLQARCVQLARMGCAVFIYDMLGYADSTQVAAHRGQRDDELCGTTPGTFGLLSPMAELRLETNFGWQTWNTIRALDFLLTVPGVDPARIACTGESGGATQTLMLGLLDERLAAAFPCVMVSTGMQGGCLCENAAYLRIGQGNVDIAAAFAPKPMGLTAANDWTKELATKGFPDLQHVWSMLGHPENLSATFATHFPHNYNHVSRTAMYAFMNEHFHLGLAVPVLERDFVVSTPAELTVWTPEHPRPAGEQTGAAHEKAVLKFWADDSDHQLATRDDLRERAWQIIVGRSFPPKGDVVATSERSSNDDDLGTEITLLNQHDSETVSCRLWEPAGTASALVIWLTDGAPSTSRGAFKPLLAAIAAVIEPQLYLQGIDRQPLLPAQADDPDRRDWTAAPAFTFGYNPPLLARRVHDVMTVVSWLKSQPAYAHCKLILAGSEGAGVTAALANVLLHDHVDRAVLATDGFRFAPLHDAAAPLFTPGAVKYGDVPGLLRLCAPARPIVFDDAARPTDRATMFRAISKLLGESSHRG